MFPGRAMMVNTAAAPCCSARRIESYIIALCDHEPGRGALKTITALPRTSRPMKSASVPVPTYAASRSSPAPDVPTDWYAGCALSTTTVFPPARAVTPHPSGSHCGGRSNSCVRTSGTPAARRRSAIHRAVSAFAIPSRDGREVADVLLQTPSIDRSVRPIGIEERTPQVRFLEVVDRRSGWRVSALLRDERRPGAERPHHGNAAGESLRCARHVILQPSAISHQPSAALGKETCWTSPDSRKLFADRCS